MGKNKNIFNTIIIKMHSLHVCVYVQRGPLTITP